MLLYRGGSRKVPIEEFFIDGNNCMQSDEVLVSIEIPLTVEVPGYD